MSESSGINTPSAFHAEMSKDWELIDALIGGTRAMREAAETFLPMEPKEKADKYRIRLARSILFNGYRDTIRNITAKPFAREVTTKGTLPAKLQPILRNVDKCGRDLTQFGKAVFREALHRGLVHVLVDFPNTGGRQNEAAERDSIHPYFTMIRAKELIGARFREHADGSLSPVLVRIREHQDVEEGKFGTKRKQFVRVWYAPKEAESGKWELYEVEGNTETLRSSGTHTFPGIPLRTLYFDRTGEFAASPCLIDLAWVNAAHWQSSSDQRNALRFARIPILFASGVTATDKDELDWSIYPGRVFALEHADAKMAYIEHSGKALDAGEKDLSKLEAQMEIMGLRPFLERTGAQTATSRQIDESRSHSDIQSWIRAEEIFIRELFVTAAKWINEEIPEDFAADIFNEFGLTLQAQADVQNLIKTRMAGEVSRETFLSELKRRGLLSDDIDIDDEIERIKDEQPTLPPMSKIPEESDDDPDDDEGGAAAA